MGAKNGKIDFVIFGALFQVKYLYLYQGSYGQEKSGWKLGI